MHKLPIKGASYYAINYKISRKHDLLPIGHLLKNQGSDTKQDKLQPEGKLIEQALHKVPIRETSYYKTHYISRET